MSQQQANPWDSSQLVAEQLKRGVLTIILVLAWLASLFAWGIMEWQGTVSTVLRVVFALNVIFHPTMFAIVWRRLLPLRFVELSCLVFATLICAGCMALHLYSPTYGADIDLRPLYLWIPVLYVFAFVIGDHKSGLRLSLAILALYVGISLPYLLTPPQPATNFTIQLLVVSGVLISALHFFAGYQGRFQRAQLTMDELTQLAHTDVLTQLPNRRRTMSMIETELTRFSRYGHTFSLILLDIDHFKAINDQFGHHVGDQTIAALAMRVHDVLRTTDAIGRWGGEEFVILLPETTLDEAKHKADTLCAHIAARPLVGNHTTTISCGVASIESADTLDTLLQRADNAMYAAKAAGRNRAVISRTSNAGVAAAE